VYAAILLVLQVEAFAEALHATSRIKDALLPCEEGVTLRTYINLKHRLDAKRLKGIATGTTDCGLYIIWMDSFFHNDSQDINSSDGSALK